MEKDADAVLGKPTADMIRQMTRSRSIPADVVDVFLTLKKLLDRVSAPLAAGLVAQLLLTAGFNPELNCYVAEQNTSDETADHPAADQIAALPGESESHSEYEGVLARGTMVSFLHKRQAANGVILDAERHDGELFYTVEMEDGEAPLLIHEDDLDEVE
jgi:recombinational DNA repair protein (RecF pathway)